MYTNSPLSKPFFTIYISNVLFSPDLPDHSLPIFLSSTCIHSANPDRTRFRTVRRDPPGFVIAGSYSPDYFFPSAATAG